MAKGRRDGQLGVPAADADSYSPYELGIINDSRLALARYHANIEAERSRLVAELEVKRKERDERIHLVRDSLEAEKEANIKRISDSIGPGSPIGTRLRDDEKDKRELARRIELEVNRPLRVTSPIFYLVLLTFLAVVEVPVNRLAFQFFFQESPIIALAIAFAVGILLVSFAHVSGIIARRFGHQRSMLAHIFSAVALLVIVCLAAAIIYYVAALRQLFVDFLEREQATDLGNLMKRGIGTITEQAIKTELGTAGWVLLLINVAIFVSGAVGSFLRHDPHPDYETAVRRARKAERRHARLQNRYQRQLDKIVRGYDERIAHINKQADAMEAEIVVLEQSLDGWDARKAGDMDVVVNVTRQRLLAYQTGNMEGRKGAKPKYFGQIDDDWLRERVLADA